MNDKAFEKQTGQPWASRYFTIWTGQAFSLLGSYIVQFALIWWLTKTTGSATVLATASIAGLLPQVLLSPLAGTYVDRWNRRVTMMAADGTVAAATVVLAILFYFGVVEVWHVYLLMFVRSAAGSFHWPAMQASTSLLVPKEHLSRIQGVNQTLNGSMNIITAPLGALLLEILPMQGVLAIDVSTALLAIIPLFFFTIPQPEKPASEGAPTRKTSVWQDFAAGLRYIWAWPGLVMILAMATIINLMLSPGFALLPILVTKHFNGQAIELAWIQSAWGVGALVGGLLLSAWGGFRRRILTSMMGLIGIAAGSLLVGMTPPTAIMLAVIAMFISGLGNPITNGPLFAAIQAGVSPDMQGRVFTIMISAASAMTPIGLMIAGPLADSFGVQTWFIIGGLVTGILGISMLFIPAILNFEEGRNEVDSQEKGTQVYIPSQGD